MNKTALLKNSTAVDVVKSAEKLPATKRQREYGDFDAFVENADKLVAFFNSVDTEIERLDVEDEFEWVEWPDPDRHTLDLKKAKEKIRAAKYKIDSARHALSQLPQVRKSLAAFKRDEKWYNRRELYEIKGKGKREREQWTLSRRVVAEQIALLLASFQNSRPGTPKVFGKMLVEEVYANNANACVLESACRRVRRTKDFPPSIAEVLKAIDEEASAWGERWTWLDEPDGIDTVDYYRRRLETAIAEAEPIIAKAEAKFAEREAKAKAEEEKRKAYQEALNRIPQPQRDAYQSGQIDAGSSHPRRCAEHIGREPGVLDGLSNPAKFDNFTVENTKEKRQVTIRVG
jgi:hypothetical protein